MHITVGKLWEENKINLAENTTQPEEEKHFDPNLKKKKTLNKQNNQGQKFSFGWKHSTRSEVILSLQLSSISEGQLISIELLETIFILANLEQNDVRHIYIEQYCVWADGFCSTHALWTRTTFSPTRISERQFDVLNSLAKSFVGKKAFEGRNSLSCNADGGSFTAEC